MDPERREILDNIQGHLGETWISPKGKQCLIEPEGLYMVHNKSAMAYAGLPIEDLNAIRIGLGWKPQFKAEDVKVYHNETGGRTVEARLIRSWGKLKSEPPGFGVL